MHQTAVALLISLATIGCAGLTGEAPNARAPAWPFHSPSGEVTVTPEDHEHLPDHYAVSVRISTMHGTALADQPVVRLREAGRVLDERVLGRVRGGYVDYDDYAAGFAGLGPGDYGLEIAVGALVHHSTERVQVARVACSGGMHENVAALDDGTRVVDGVLQLARWRALDERTDWLVEWVRNGRVMARSEDPHAAFTEQEVLETALAVRWAVVRLDSDRCWAPFAFGKESYGLPEVVRHTPGAWEARVFHSGAPPVSVAFTLDAAGDAIPSDPDARRGFSARLATRALTSREAAQGQARLAARAHARAPAPDPAPHPYAPQVPWSPALTRAVVRSPEVVRTLIAFLDANRARSVTIGDDDAPDDSPETRWQVRRAMQQAVDRDARREAAAARRDVVRLRARLVSLVARYGGPWRTDEWPTTTR